MFKSLSLGYIYNKKKNNRTNKKELDKMLLKEKQGSLFLPFVDSSNNKVCVIYKLNDGKNFGIVEPEA